MATVILGGLITSTVCEYVVHPGLFWRFSGSEAKRLTQRIQEGMLLAKSTRPTCDSCTQPRFRHLGLLSPQVALSHVGHTSMQPVTTRDYVVLFLIVVGSLGASAA